VRYNKGKPYIKLTNIDVTNCIIKFSNVMMKIFKALQ